MTKPMLFSTDVAPTLLQSKTLLSDQSENGYQCCPGKGSNPACGTKLKIPIFEYTPLQVKTAVTGYGKAKTTGYGNDSKAFKAERNSETR